MGIVNIEAILRLYEGEDTVVALDAQLGLDKVRLDKDPLVERLKKNRDKHQEEYAEIVDGWKGEVILKMKKYLKQAQEENRFRLVIGLDKPVNHTEDYDHIIRMLEASVDDVIILTSREFRQYHEDEWHWKGEHQLAVQNFSKMR